MQTNQSVSVLRLIRKFAAPLSTVVLMMVGGGFFTTFISLKLERQGYSGSAIGFIQAMFFLGMFLGAFQMEKIIKRVGHIQALTVFGSLATSVVLLQAVFPSYFAWLILRFFSGLSLAAIYIVVESWMLANSQVKERGVVLSLYMISFLGAQAVSQHFLTLLDIDSSFPFIISAVFTSFSVMPVGLSKEKVPIPTDIETMSFAKIIKLTPFGTVGCFISGLFMSVLYAFFPLFATSRLIPSEYVMSLTILGGIVLQWPLGKLSDFFERRLMLFLTVAFAMLIALASYSYTGYDRQYLLISSFLLGGFAFALYPLSLTQVCDHIASVEITRATALMLITYGFGSVLGPITASQGVEAFGIRFIFLYFAAILFLMGGVGLITMIRRPSVPLEQQGEFVPMVTVTPIASELDPRSD